MGNAVARFSPDGRWFLAAADREYYMFAINGHATNWPKLWSTPRETGGFTPGSAAFAPDGSCVALQANGHVIRLLKTFSGEELTRLTPLSVGTSTLAWSSDGRWVAAESELGIHLWDLTALRGSLRALGLDWTSPASLAKR